MNIAKLRGSNKVGSTFLSVLYLIISACWLNGGSEITTMHIRINMRTAMSIATQSLLRSLFGLVRKSHQPFGQVEATLALDSVAVTRTSSGG